MLWKNPHYNRHGTIEVELYDKEMQCYLPFTASPDDFEELGRLLHAEILAAGEVAPFIEDPRTQEELNEDINAERARRIVAGRSFGPIYVTGSDRDIANLGSLQQGAQLRLGMGDTETTIKFRDGNNIVHLLKPMEVVQLWMTASLYVSSLYEASWDIKAMDPIPQNVTSDEYWPPSF